jgi:hypothetical protein
MNKKQLLALRLIAVFLVLLGFSLAVGSWFVSQRKMAIYNAGKETTATVLNAKHEKGPQNRNSYFVTLRYSSERDNSVTQNIQVPDDVFSRAMETRELRIRFDPSNPAEVVFVDFPYDVVQRYVEGAILAAVGFLITYFAFRASSG